LSDGAADAIRAPASFGNRDQGAVQFVLGAAELPVDRRPGWRPDGLLSKMEAGAESSRHSSAWIPEAVRRYAARLLDLGVAKNCDLIASLPILGGARAAG